MELTFVHVVGINQDASLLRRDLRAGVRAQRRGAGVLRDGADDRSDGRERKDDVAAMGLEEGREDRRDQRWRARIGIDGDAGMASERRTFCDGGKAGAGDMERGGVRSGEWKAGALDRYEEANHAGEIYRGWRLADPGGRERAAAAEERYLAALGPAAG